MNHYANKDFWSRYDELPKEIQRLAHRKFELLKRDPWHPSLHFKRIDPSWSVRIGPKYRALAEEIPGGFIWYWIGRHGEYDKKTPGQTAGDTFSMKYLVNLIYDREYASHLAEAPTPPGCMSQGMTVQEALGNVKDAIQAYLDGLEECDYTPRNSSSAGGAV